MVLCDKDDQCIIVRPEHEVVGHGANRPLVLLEHFVWLECSIIYRFYMQNVDPNSSQ
jgi:hypothetical protein